jgi:2,4-dienoyl-CoA reductase-like NADH-dependent reductase (Old Yellow Enzyme family)
MTDILSSFRLGPIDLANRLVMAPMTRIRAIMQRSTMVSALVSA